MSFLRPYKVKVFAAIVFLFIGSLAWLSLGQGVKLMVDEGFIANNSDRLNEIILLIVAIMMGFTSVKLTGLVLLAVPLVLGPVAFFGNKVRRFSRESQDRVGDLGAYIDETLHEIHTVQAYTHEAEDNAAFATRVEAVMSVAKGRIKYRALLISTVMFLSISAIAFVTWVGAQDVMLGKISAGELSAFMFYAVMVAGAVATISEVFSEIQRASGATERLIELSQVPTDIIELAQPQSLIGKTQGALALSELVFAYPSEPNTEVINHLNIDIKAGERVALVGPSGAGKSTLFELLLRFYQPKSGAISLDGIDIANLSLSQIRQQYALVPQESVIFAASVFENVRYGRIDATAEEVKQACIAAKADEFIVDFPQGYETY